MNVLAVCSGIGGLDLGIRLAEPSARVICYVENGIYPISITLSRIQDGFLDDAPVWSDARTFDGKPWRGVVDILTAGYPCQPFSVAGSLKGEDDPRHLWPDIRRIIRQVQPGFCFFENVANHLRVGFESVWGDLSDLGYTVEAGLFTATEVGAPHRRQRLFILAHRNGNDVGNPDKPRSQGRSEPQQQGRDKLPAWPPGPTDTDAWAAILEQEPGLEPAVCRVADGISYRVDQLTALGNSVVPAVAAQAWRQLRKEALR
jgi:DNA (cytosine-5)-methyltransferase 1